MVTLFALQRDIQYIISQESASESKTDIVASMEKINNKPTLASLQNEKEQTKM
jgi:hypothetical protein